MQSTLQRSTSTRDRWVVAGLALVSVACATPGVHLAELWLPHEPAVLVSHGLALIGLAITAWQWRVRRARRQVADAPPA